LTAAVFPRAMPTANQIAPYAAFAEVCCAAERHKMLIDAYDPNRRKHPTHATAPLHQNLQEPSDGRSNISFFD
jgi:hypothetical protein